MVRICENCGKEHDGNYGSGRFCCKKCAKSFSTKNENIQLKVASCIDCGKEIFINKRASLFKCRCNECYIKHNTKLNKCPIFTDVNCTKCFFKENNICKDKRLKAKLNTLIKYCKFNKDCINDYKNCIKEYLRIKENIQFLLDSGLSGADICKKEFNKSTHGNTIFKILNCKTLNLSESISNAYLNGKFDKCYYKEGWHTTWENKEFYLRSSYELDYAKELDEKKISYDYENFKIKYFDSQQQKFRCAIPDFYIPSENMIVEIKSVWTLNIQEMKDKVNAYKNLGYNFKLILEHKDTDLNKL